MGSPGFPGSPCIAWGGALTLAQSLFIFIIAILLTLFATGGPKSEPPPAPAPPAAVETPQQAPSEETPSEGDVLGEARVLADRVPLWESTEATRVLAELNEGETVDVLEQQGDWWRVRDREGRTGFVRSFFLKTVDPGSSSPIVLGYYMATANADKALRSHVEHLTALAPWTWRIGPDGSLNPDFSQGSTAAALAFAGRKGLDTHVLIHNFQGGAFDAGLAVRILTSPDVRTRIATELLQLAKTWHFKGVHVDFENVPPEAKDDLTQFIAELAGHLRPAGIQLSMAVPARTRTTGGQGYDYGALARYLDFMVVMTYDQHWQGGPPGPIAGIDWVNQVVDYMLDVGVPANKLVLGLAGYGYDWSVSRAGTEWAQALTYAQVMARFEEARRRDPSVKLQWHPQAHVPYFTYGDRIVYFENADSLSHKLKLVRDRGLAGVALWRLGQEDPGLWPLVRYYLGAGRPV